MKKEIKKGESWRKGYQAGYEEGLNDGQIGFNIKTPSDWRKGQTLFNFLEWLHQEKRVFTNQAYRMADPFYLEDEEMDKYWNEFINNKYL